MSTTFKFVKEEELTREQLLQRITQLYKSKANEQALYKLQKQLRLKDKISDADAYAYYRQLDEWLAAQ